VALEPPSRAFRARGRVRQARLSWRGLLGRVIRVARALQPSELQAFRNKATLGRRWVLRCPRGPEWVTTWPSSAPTSPLLPLPPISSRIEATRLPPSRVLQHRPKCAGREKRSGDERSMSRCTATAAVGPAACDADGPFGSAGGGVLRLRIRPCFPAASNRREAAAPGGVPPRFH